MTPEERQLLSGLFDRIQGASNQPRDRDAESFISDAVRSKPYAPYLMAQTVIVQDQALQAANERLQQLEAQLRDQQGAGQPQETSFLGNLGKSLFGAGQSQPQQRATMPATGGYGGAPMAPGAQSFNQQPQGGPWGNQGAGYASGAAQPQGGGFLKGALGAAAGVAGGVLLADSIRGLFGGGNNAFGIASGFGGGGFGGGGFGAPGGETIVNNYYDNAAPGGDAVDPGYDNSGQDFGQDMSDDGGGNFDPGGDDSYNV